MAHYRATLDTAREREDAFAYLSDFSTTRAWDPGVVEAERLSEAAIGKGAEFRLVAEFLGRQTVLSYRIVEYDPPRAVTLRGENATVISTDRITFEELDHATRITYDAELVLKGPLALADTLLRPAFTRICDRALAGLRDKLPPAPADELNSLSGRALDGRVYGLPRDLPKPHNLLVVAFRREQQAVVDRWLPWLIRLEQRRPDVGVFEVPVLPSKYGPVRWFIDGGMTRGIPDPAARARTVVVYTDVQRVVENLGLAGTHRIAVVAVERSGRIVGCEVGGFDREKAERLAMALGPEPPAKAAAA